MLSRHPDFYCLKYRGLEKFIDVQQFFLPYRVTMMNVFLLTVIVDLAVAVQMGLILTFVTFVYRSLSLLRIESAPVTDFRFLEGQEDKVAAYRIYSALFFGAIQLLEKIEQWLP